MIAYPALETPGPGAVVDYILHRKAKKKEISKLVRCLDNHLALKSDREDYTKE